MKKPTGCPRHLFTAVASTPTSQGGFRTVAHSPELDGDLVETIEGLVDGYKASDPGTPACHQLLPVSHQIYAFTVFTPTGPTPEGRPGNYWAETLIVPGEWLATGGWDTAAAFDCLEWWGPRQVDELGKSFPAAVLPSLQPGPVDRLARLVAAVPENQLYSLLLAVVQQSQGLRKIRLIEPPEAEPEILEDVVTLLPLLVPPALRTYREDDSRRCLTWRTRSPLGAMAPAADLTGFPALAADALEHEREASVVVDLGGRLPAPAPRDRFGERYARWLHETLVQGRWQELEALYAGEISGPAAAWFAGFSGGVPVYEEQQAAWKTRDAVEGQAWALLENHRRQLEANLSELRQELDEAARKASEQWTKALERRRDDFEIPSGQPRATATRATPADRGLAARVATLEQEVRQLRVQLGVDEAVSTIAEDRREGFAQQADSLWSRWKRRLQRRDAVALIVKVGIPALLVAAAVVWGAMPAVRSFYSERRPIPESTGTSAQAPEVLRQQRRENLLQQLRNRETAILLLRQAGADEGYRQRVDSVLLALTLGRQASLFDEVGKAVLQQALDITADGQWGPDSSRSLRDHLPAACAPCATTAAEDAGGFLAWDSPEASCFLIVHLQLDEPPCPGSSPWREGRVWTEAEAREALRLIQATATNSTDQQITAQISRIDPGRTQELWSAVPAPTLKQAEMLFDLAYAVVGGDPRADAPEQLSAKRLDELGALLEQLGPQASEASASGGTG